MICGVQMPDGMKQNDKFPVPLITPATKAEDGDHDEDISRENIVYQGIVSKEDYEQLEKYTRDLFQRGTEIAAKQELILVDTKYEFGKRDGVIYLIDEIHTPDSSRFFYADGYQERQDKDEQQKQLSKEFVREWLIENGFQGLEGQEIPPIPDSFVNTITERYTELYEKITGETFVKADNSNLINRIEKNVTEYLR
jgi:phosphoribosylaminoimidazole-succinocarboxamide synthase